MAELARFADPYEELLSVVGEALQYGPSSGLERRYAALRNEARAAYACVKPFLECFDDALQLEALLTAGTLADLLRDLERVPISWIERTRRPVSLYAEHLRHLTARTR